MDDELGTNLNKRHKEFQSKHIPTIVVPLKFHPLRTDSYCDTTLGPSASSLVRCKQQREFGGEIKRFLAMFPFWDELTKYTLEMTQNM